MRPKASLGKVKTIFFHNEENKFYHSHLAKLSKVGKWAVHPELGRRVGISENLNMVDIIVIINIIILIIMFIIIFIVLMINIIIIVLDKIISIAPVF